MTDTHEDERAALLERLEYQRASVRSIVSGLAEELWHVSVVPSGWTVAGIIEHLGDAERHWFQGVVAGRAEDPLPWDVGRPAYDPERAFTCERPSADVLAYYRQQCDRGDAVIAATTMSTRPIGRHFPDFDIPTVRWVVLHVIEETAAHSGHLDIAREMLDGGRGLGLR